MHPDCLKRIVHVTSTLIKGLTVSSELRTWPSEPPRGASQTDPKEYCLVAAERATAYGPLCWNKPNTLI